MEGSFTRDQQRNQGLDINCISYCTAFTASIAAGVRAKRNNW